MTTKHYVWLLCGLLGLSLAVAVYNSYTLRQSDEPRKVKEGFCPDCGRELPAMGGECINCKTMKLRDPLARPAGARRSLNGADYFLLGLLLFLIIGGGILTFRRVKSTARAKADPRSLYTRCPKCKRRLRYSPLKMGKEILCPTCRYALMAPWREGVTS
jgi:hypothetical protein